MTRRAVTLALLAATALGCKSKKEPKKVPPPAPFDERVAAREDCLHHAAAIAAVPDAWLVIGACGHTGGEEATEALEEILSVRVSRSGVAAESEPLTLMPRGWATNVLVAPVAGSGALVAWTAALDGGARVQAIAVDQQGRGARAVVDAGEGRALAMAPGPQGAALAVVTEPETLSDADPRAGLRLDLVVLDAEGAVGAREGITTRVDAMAAQVALRGVAGGYELAWIEGGRLLGARTDADGKVLWRGALIGDLAALRLPESTRLAWPAIDADAGWIAVVVNSGGGDEIWAGEGAFDAGQQGLAWRRVVPPGGRARTRLSLQAGALVWSEQAGEFPELRWAPAGGGEVATLAPGAVIFDGSVAIASAGGVFAVAAATPPGAGGPSAIQVVQVQAVASRR